MPLEITATKHTQDSEIAKMVGTFIDVGSDWTTISQTTHPSDVITVYKPDNKLLCKIQWNAIPIDLCKTGYDAYRHVGKHNIGTNRGLAAGSTRNRTYGYEKGIYVDSSVFGYLSSTNHKTPCRMTRFNRDHFDKYTSGLPFVYAIDKCFRQHIPEAYKKQLHEARKTEFHIPSTAFSTVTVNYNFRTALHCDSGDYRDGFGNLVVLHSQNDVIVKGVISCALLFPQYKVAVYLDTGDFMAMDVHELHCNSSLNSEVNRLSFVCYLRDSMYKCTDINKRLMGIYGSLGEKHDNEEIFNSIVGKDCVKNVLGHGKTGLEWWEKVSSNGRFKLQYKHKQYIFWDNETGQKINNLIPALEYILKNNTI